MFQLSTRSGVPARALEFAQKRINRTNDRGIKRFKNIGTHLPEHTSGSVTQAIDDFLFEHNSTWLLFPLAGVVRLVMSTERSTDRNCLSLSSLAGFQTP